MSEYYIFSCIGVADSKKANINRLDDLKYKGELRDSSIMNVGFKTKKDDDFIAQLFACNISSEYLKSKEYNTKLPMLRMRIMKEFTGISFNICEISVWFYPDDPNKINTETKKQTLSGKFKYLVTILNDLNIIKESKWSDYDLNYPSSNQKFIESILSSDNTMNLIDTEWHRVKLEFVSSNGMLNTNRLLPAGTHVGFKK